MTSGSARPAGFHSVTPRMVVDDVIMAISTGYPFLALVPLAGALFLGGPFCLVGWSLGRKDGDLLLAFPKRTLQADDLIPKPSAAGKK